MGDPESAKTVTRRSHYLAAVVLLFLGLLGFMAAVVAMRPPEPKVSYEISEPNPQWREVPTGFLPEQMAWGKPLLRATACMFAFRAIRHSLDPAKVGFHGCGDRINVSFDENYYQVTVSGTAMVDGNPRPFTATLNHYPPAINEWAFVATDIKVGD